MEDLEILEVAMEAWLKADPDNRHIFSITGDKRRSIRHMLRYHQ